jgi:hypothetical protein
MVPASNKDCSPPQQVDVNPLSAYNNTLNADGSTADQFEKAVQYTTASTHYTHL